MCMLIASFGYSIKAIVKGLVEGGVAGKSELDKHTTMQPAVIQSMLSPK